MMDKEFDNMQIRLISTEDFESVLQIAKRLREWFTDSGIKQMSSDLKVQVGHVAAIDENIVGFIIYSSSADSAKIEWLGVDPSYHRRGVGTALLKKLEKELKNKGIKTIRVETLGESVEYQPYEQTRAFYRKNGFIDEKVIQQDNPEWKEKLIMKKELI